MDIILIRIAIRFARVFLDFILAFLFLTKGKSKATFHLGLVFLFFGAYALPTGLLEYMGDNRLFLVRFQWVAVLALPALITFISYFTDKTKHIKLKMFLWYIPAIIIVVLAVVTDYFVVSVSSIHPYVVKFGILDNFARVVIIVMGGIFGSYYFIRGYRESQGFKRGQMKYLLVAAIVFVAGTVMTLGVLPLYPRTDLIYFYDIADDVLSSFVTIFMVYIIASKKMVFEMKVIITEILVGAIALVLFIQAFLAQEIISKVIGFVTFFFFLFAGYLLIRTTQKEIEKKEEVERLAGELKGLNQNLEEKVKERTMELETSYQEIKSRKDDLERFYNLAVGRESKMAELKKKLEG
jgi:hypothetical protein